MRFVALAVLAATAAWEPVRPGVWQRESRMASTGPLAPVRAVAVRIDPRRVVFSLGPVAAGRPWTIDSVGALDAVAFNAGQFRTSGSWGWVVRDGVEMQPPGSGSVAMGFVVDSNGVPSLVDQSELPARRGHVRLAFQSYPALLVGDGSVPWELQESGRGVDLTHRDSRLALGIRDDGSVVVVLTRFTGLGRGAGEMLPWARPCPRWRRTCAHSAAGERCSSTAAYRANWPSGVRTVCCVAGRIGARCRWGSSRRRHAETIKVL